MQQVNDLCRIGKQGRPAASPTSVLEEGPIISDWSMWASSPIELPTSLHASPIHTSPLRPSMNSPLGDGMPSRRGSEGNNSSSASTRSLVETLQNCLTSLPQSSSNMSDPSGAPSTTTTSRQCSSRPPGKRRPRASRRTPTTILETNPSEFRDMVQKLTGIPSATPAAAPVRPHPQRASPNNVVRPETLRSIRRLPPISSPPRALTPSPITFLQHMQRNHTPLPAMAPTSLNQPFSNSSSICKREFPDESSSPPYGSHENAMKRAMSAPTTSMQSWWSDNDDSRAPNTSSPCNDHSTSGLPKFSMSSGDALTNAIFSAASGTSTASPDFARLDSADGQLTHEDQDFSFSHMEIESWLSAQDHAAAESLRG